MRLIRKSATSSSINRWTERVALATLLAGCSSEVGAPGGPFAGNMANGSTTTGNVVDANGNVVDANGNLVGTVDANGNVVDANGNVVDATGNVVDANGNVVDTTATGVGGATGATTAAGGAAAGSAATGVAATVDCTPGIVPTSQIPRLTNIQYDRTVRDLLGVTGLTASSNQAPSNILATEQDGGLSELGWSSYKTVASQISAQVMADPTLQANYINCDLAVATCLSETIVAFGRRAFRRPLSAAEVASFEKVLAQGAEITATGTPAEVAEALLYMFLISPSFLQRSEITSAADAAGNFVLSSHELASRLSYMLWGSMPDDTLNLAADQGLLSTPAEILAQAQRMLQDDKARDMVAGFHRDYLHLTTNSRWDSAKKDATLFPNFTDGVVPAMVAETEQFFENVVFDQGGTFQDLLLSPVAFVNADTAPLYGLNPADFGPQLTQTTLEGRPGFLTRIGFLSAYAATNRTSPILRGAFITKDVVGFDPGAPPPGAEGAALPPASADINTNRKQVEQQTSPPECAGCHANFINPPGFALESFDATGAIQTVEASTGAPIDTVVEASIDGSIVSLTNASDLMTAIAASPAAKAHYAKKWVEYAYERREDADACTAQQLGVKMTADGYTVLNLIADLTQAESFRIRAVEVTP